MPSTLTAAALMSLVLASLFNHSMAQNKEGSPAPVKDSQPHKFTNHLANEKSPYLLQHAHNPVNWYPWGEEAFEKAKKENKPILLSIGYSTCHWCHVMERESFENEKVAELLNKNYVCIKLDREERPDIDSIYMTAMSALDLGGGWPLNVFLTPDRKPFYGGTYFKTEQFLKLTDMVSSKWKKDAAGIQKSADGIASELGKVMGQGNLKPGDVKAEWTEDTAKAFEKTFDPKFGGYGKAPKFPQPQVPELLLHTGTKAKDQARIEQVLFTCRRMAAGGIYDHLGGGFARYSVDGEWLVPHFEKMLYDNAQLLNLYLNAYLITKDEQYATVARDILRYVFRDMTHADGGFYSAEDADSEGHEGKFYCWTEAELKEILTADEFATAAAYFGITAKGNFVDHSHPKPLEGQNILSIVKPEEKAPASLQGIKQKLFDIRAKRIRPHLDDKILVSWNGLMLGPLARAAIILDDPSYLAAARKNVAFVQSKLWDASTKTLYHRFRDGHRDSAQLLSAYASYLSGTIELYQCTLDPKILDFAVDIAEGMITKFYDPKDGGFFSNDTESALIFRAKDDSDSAEPGNNSQAILALLKLATITDDNAETKKFEFKAKALQSLKLYSERLEKAGQSLPLMLQAVCFASREPYRVVVVGDPADSQTHALLRAAHSVYQPEKVILGTIGKVEEFAKGQPMKGDKPTIYVCTGQECQLPTNDPKEVAGKFK